MLIIDSREKKGSKLVDLVESKATALSIPFEKRWIEVGDYVYDDVCFEAKSSIDFLGSVLSKRMWTQIDNMDRNYKTNIVIIYGTIKEAVDAIIENSYSKLPVASRKIMFNNKFLGAIGRITLDTDVKAFWVPTEKEAALIITSVCKMKPIDRDVIRPQVIKRISTDDLRIDVLTSIKGISVKKAKALLKKFGSIAEIAHTPANEINSIDGIGPTIASRVLEVLNTEKKVKI
jgi:ERCC4-type nuclease|tara:strand:+ start:315 stop:1010 length:696 start_codon:yes stop_codon:yes gene_type:complete